MKGWQEPLIYFLRWSLDFALPQRLYRAISTLYFVSATMFTRHRIAQVAVEYPVGKLTFVISDKDEFKDELERFGFTDLNEEKEIRMGIMGADGEMYPLHNVERVTSAEIKQFAEDFLAGKKFAHLEELCTYAGTNSTA